MRLADEAPFAWLGVDLRGRRSSAARRKGGSWVIAIAGRAWAARVIKGAMRFRVRGDSKGFKFLNRKVWLATSSPSPPPPYSNKPLLVAPNHRDADAAVVIAV